MRIAATLLAAALATAAPGCGGGPRLVPVSGTVTLEGKPAGGAHVTFAPRPGEAGGTAGGDVTGASGYYKAMAGPKAGLTPGRYTVVVSMAAGPDGPAPSPGSDPYMATLARRARAADDPSVRVAEVTATFDREVVDGDNTFDFDLKLPPPPEPEPEPEPARSSRRAGARKGNPTQGVFPRPKRERRS